MRTEDNAPEMPWNSLLKFHREIRLRAEKSFFSALAADQQSERWSGLANFEPANLAGPWHLRAESIVSEPVGKLIASAEAGDYELGGVCWYAWEKPIDGSPARLEYRPALVRQVAATIDEDGGLMLEPLQGGWDFSPLFYQWFERLQMRETQVAGLDDALPRILEKVGQGTDGTLESRFIDALSTFFPALADGITKSQVLGARLNRRPSNWILLQPSLAGAGFGVNLIRDYNALVEREISGEGAGGLRVLSGISQPKNAHSVLPALPLIALNEAQEEAVRRVFEFPPVTVISGPPGCGKSQLVSSILLNGFAHGVSVLLASTNNQAVDVVGTRLKEFKIRVVRAGNAKKSNIAEVLKTVAWGAAPPKGEMEKLAKTADERARLQQDCESIRQRLATGNPLRIEESLDAAIKAYGNALRIETEKQSHQQMIEQAAAEIACPGAMAAFEKVWLKPLSDWLDKISQVREQIEKDRAKEAKLNDVISQVQRDVTADAASLGIPVADLDSLLTHDDPSALQRLSKCIAEIEQIATAPETIQAFSLPSYDSAYEAWADATEGDSWAEKAEELARQIGRAIYETREDREAISRVDDALLRRRAAPSIAKLSEVEMQAVERDALRTWLTAYATHLTTPKTYFSSWPWSGRWKSERAMQKIEALLRSQLPTAIWRDTGVLDNNGREHLADVLNAILNWQTAKVEVERAASARQLFDQRFEDLGELAHALIPFIEMPSSLDNASWDAVCHKFENRAALARLAAAYKRHRTLLDTVVARLTVCQQTLNDIGKYFPLWARFCERQGKNNIASMQLIHSGMSRDDWERFSGELSIPALKDARDFWKSIFDAHRRLGELKLELLDIPSRERRLSNWRSQRPAALSETASTLTDFPDERHEVFDHLFEREKLWQRWLHFSTVTVPKADQERDDEMARAQHELLVAMRLAPEVLPPISALAVALAKAFPWNLTEVVSPFNQLTETGLQRALAKVDSRLQSAHLAQAKINWVERLEADPAALAGVRAVMRSINSKRPVEQVAFAATLRAAPVWITIGAGTKDIPLVPGLFDILIIDEATQCTLTDMLPLIFRCKHLVVLGDPEQLPAIGAIGRGMENALAERFGVEAWMSQFGHNDNDAYQTALKTLPALSDRAVHLTDHYRSHPLIIGFSNINIYHKSLRLLRHRYEGGAMDASGVFAVGVSGVAERGPNNASWINKPEAEAVVETVRGLRGQGGRTDTLIGVVTPFKAQTDRIRLRLEQENLAAQVLVNTVYAFQGDERDIMIFSPVVAMGMSEGAARWVEQPSNLINVAVTRARDAFYLVADYSDVPTSAWTSRQAFELCAESGANSQVELCGTGVLQLDGDAWLRPRAPPGRCRYGS